MEDLRRIHGAFSWNELMTTDVAGAKEFYGKLFGWKAEDMPMGGGFTYTILKVGERMVGGLMPMMPEAKGVPPNWRSYVSVENIDETAKQAEKLGGKVLMQPHDIPEVGRFAVIQDPQGAVVMAITYLKE